MFIRGHASPSLFYMPKKIKAINLTEDDIAAIQRMVYGEAASEDYATMKMIAQTAINRLRSGRKKEFGGNINRILQKGYYAVKNPNQPYRQALSGKFEDEASKKKWLQAQKAVSDVIGKQDWGQAMFYFVPGEIKKQTEAGTFDFKQVAPTGDVGIYKTFGYPEAVSHYGG